MTKQTAISIIAVFWLLSIICGGVAGFFLYPHVYPCNSNVGSVVVSVTDSCAPAKDTAPVSWQPLVKKVETRKYIKQPESISYDIYNIEMIIAIAFRVCSKESVLLRQFVISKISTATKETPITLFVSCSRGNNLWYS